MGSIGEQVTVSVTYPLIYVYPFSFASTIAYFLDWNHRTEKSNVTAVQSAPAYKIHTDTMSVATHLSYVSSMDYNISTIVSTRLHLHHWCNDGHDHRHGDAEHPSMVGQCQGMIPCTGSNNTQGLLVLR